MKGLKDKIALVTASTRGIGRACAERLAAEGAKVYIAARNPGETDRVAEEIARKGGRAAHVFFDADKAETYTTMVGEVIRSEGRLDILINNFGTTDVARDLDVASGDSEAFFDIVNRNLRSVYLSSKAVLPHMARNGGGSIVNISSIGGVEPDLSRTAYGVSKAAINFLTQDIAVQYASQGIRCNAVLPGFIATDAAMGNMSPEFLAAFTAAVPLARAGSPEEIASAAAFLASDEASFITGMLLPVAGGFGVPTPLYNTYMSMKSRG